MSAAAATSPVETHGDPTSLLVGPPFHSIWLSVPLEIWTQIFDGEIQVTDLTLLRSVSKTLWTVADRLMPFVASRAHPEHAHDPRMADSFYAEIVIAAHRLNVHTPLNVLVKRDGSCDTADSQSSGKAKKASKAKEMQEEEKVPTRAEWIIGSRRVLHTVHANGRPWPFGVCGICKTGECRLCSNKCGKLQPVTDAWWCKESKARAAPTGWSKAIFGGDAFFCEPCKTKEGEL